MIDPELGMSSPYVNANLNGVKAEKKRTVTVSQTSSSIDGADIGKFPSNGTSF